MEGGDYDDEPGKGDGNPPASRMVGGEGVGEARSKEARAAAAAAMKTDQDDDADDSYEDEDFVSNNEDGEGTIGW